MEFCVYRFLDINNNILYVGQSANLERRIKHHKSRKVWFNEVEYIEYIPYNSKYKMELYERYFISKFKPKYNDKYFKYDNSKIEHTNYSFLKYIPNSIINLDNRFISEVNKISKELNILPNDLIKISFKYFVENINNKDGFTCNK